MPYAQFTLSEMRSLAYQRLGNNLAFFRNDEIDRYIRESLRTWNLLTGYWRDELDLGPTVAGQVWYDLPTSVNYALRIECNGKTLGSSSLWDLDYGQPTWETVANPPPSTPTIPEAWAPAGVNLIAIWPYSSAGGDSLIADCVVRAPQPTLDADFVDMGREELDQVLSYVEHLAVFKEGGQEFDASKEMLKAFLKGAATRNSMLKQSARFRQWMGLPDDRKRPMRASPERVGTR